MRIKTLPAKIKEILGVEKRDVAAYLKKVQDYHCDRLTLHDLCPGQCWRCFAHLEGLATSARDRGNSHVGYWQRVLQSYVAEQIEIDEDLEKTGAPKHWGGQDETMTAEEAAQALLEEWGL
jgi:hypothetical protein